jgi:phage terminase large subunit-like protein
METLPGLNPWRTALPDWERRIMARESLVPDLPLFDQEAQKALRIFKRLRVPDIIGKPTLGEACGPWFFPIVAALFGSYDEKAQRRMIQEYFLLIPKGNSKSSNGGAVMLTATIVNRRPEAEFNFIAPTLSIAGIAFNQAKNTIRADAELVKAFHIQEHIRTITHRVTGAKLQIKAADTDIVTGGKPVGTMIDETHVFAKKGNAADILLEIRGALGKRPDGFLFQTTTQSKEAPSGVFKSELGKARAVRDGEIDLPLLPILYEFPEKALEAELWKDRRYWPVVNPNLNRSLDETFLVNELASAERDGIDKLILLASQHFNVQIGSRLRGDRWTGAEYWDRQGRKEITLRHIIEHCDVAVVGIDGGGLDDLLGLAVIGRHRETRHWLNWNHAWAHPEVLERRKEIAPKLRDFAEEGDLTICEDPTQDLRELADTVAIVKDAGLLPEKNGIGLDAMGVGALVDELSARGIEDEECIAIGQGYRLSPAIWGIERKLKDGTFWHGGSGLMAFCTGNAKIEQRGNAVAITKQAAGRGKIDPLCATFNAGILMGHNPEPKRQPEYQALFAG